MRKIILGYRFRQGEPLSFSPYPFILCIEALTKSIVKEELEKKVAWSEGKSTHDAYLPSSLHKRLPCISQKANAKEA